MNQNEVKSKWIKNLVLLITSWKQKKLNCIDTVTTKRKLMKNLRLNIRFNILKKMCFELWYFFLLYIPSAYITIINR